MKFAWTAGSRIKINAQDAGERLQHLRKKRRGYVMASDVVKDAKNPDSPLHDHFDWNDTEAARKWRLDQAGYLLRSITVVYEDDGVGNRQPVRSFVRVHHPDDMENVGYEDTKIAMSDDRLRLQVLTQAKQELKVWTRRYRRLTEFASVVAEADAVLA